MATLPNLQTLIRSIRRRGGPTPLERLRYAVDASDELATLGDAVVDHFVEDARQQGHSWSDIGEVLGMTKQAAQQRFRVRWFDRFTRARRAPSSIGLTDRARRAVDLAQEEARRLEHNYIGTEHLLLGLLRVHGGVAAKVLLKLDVSIAAIRQKVEEHVGRGDQPVRASVPFTPRAKKTLELARGEAHALGHNYVGTEHILLALAAVDDGLAARFLTELGASHDALRTTVVSFLAKQTS